jgi:hypothetical protein
MRSALPIIATALVFAAAPAHATSTGSPLRARAVVDHVTHGVTRMMAPQAGTQIVTPAGVVAQPFQRWVQEAKVPTPPGTVTLYPSGSCPFSESCAWPWEHRISVTDDGSRWERRVQLLHELGHVYDYQRMTDSTRATFVSIMRLGPTGWWQRPQHSEPWDDGAPAEQFAQAYALCALAVRRDDIQEWDSVYGYWPTRQQHLRVCSLIR